MAEDDEMRQELTVKKDSVPLVRDNTFWAEN